LIYHAPNGNVSRARFALDVLVGVLDRDSGDVVGLTLNISSSGSIFVVI